MSNQNESIRLKALIVDDEGIERRGLSMLFHRLALPYTVDEAANGEDAMAMLNADSYDVLLTDIRMPFMDGLSLSHEVRKLFPAMPIIIFTAHADFDMAQRAIREKVSRYLLKPVNVLEFKDVMEDIARGVLRNREMATPPSPFETEIREYRQQEMHRQGCISQIKQISHHTIGLALEMIHTEYMTDLTLSGVADRLYLNPSYFSTLFRKETGKSFVHYLNDIRLQHAAQMLLESSRPVKEVGKEVGFAGDSYFIQRFRDHFGCTPQHYRSAHGGNESP